MALLRHFPPLAIYQAADQSPRLLRQKVEMIISLQGLTNFPVFRLLCPPGKKQHAVEDRDDEQNADDDPQRFDLDSLSSS